MIMFKINCKKDEIEVLESLCKNNTYFAEEFGKYFELFKENINNDFPITFNADIVKLHDFQRKLIVSVLKLYQNQIENIDKNLLSKEQIDKNKNISTLINGIIKRLKY